MAAALQGFQDRQFDVYINGGNSALPSSRTARLTSKLRIIGLTKEQVDNATPEMLAPTKALGRSLDTVPDGIYGDNVVTDGDVYTLGAVVGVVARLDLADDAVYNITKAFWENIDAERATSPYLDRVTLGGALVAKNLRLHPGARRVLRRDWPGNSCRNRVNFSGRKLLIPSRTPHARRHGYPFRLNVGLSRQSRTASAARLLGCLHPRPRRIIAVLHAACCIFFSSAFINNLATAGPINSGRQSRPRNSGIARSSLTRFTKVTVSTRRRRTKTARVSQLTSYATTIGVSAAASSKVTVPEAASAASAVWNSAIFRRSDSLPSIPLASSTSG